MNNALVAWGRDACAKPGVGNLVARAVPEESEQICYQYPPERPNKCGRKIEIQVANCGSRTYDFIGVTEPYLDYEGNHQVRSWEFDGIGPAGAVTLPIPIAIAEQRGLYWVNRPPPPEHQYRIFARADRSPADEAQVVAIVRDPAFESAQKQYCTPLADQSADGASAQEPAKLVAKNVVELTLIRTACFGYCPAYRVHLRTDGTVVYEGQSNVRVKGREFDHVAPAEVLALVAQFDAAAAEAPVRRDPHLRCSRGNADAPTTRVTLQRHGRELRMPLLGHCAPPHERELADEIDHVAQSERWVTGSKECRDRGLW
jgi:hypothetical protein